MGVKWLRSEHDPEVNQTMGQDARHEALRSKHAEIEHLLTEEERRPLPDFNFVHELKRKKLKIKDELQRFVAI